jgi:hypothetical protein
MTSSNAARSDLEVLNERFSDSSYRPLYLIAGLTTICCQRGRVSTGVL